MEKKRKETHNCGATSEQKTGIFGSCDVVKFLFNLICSPPRINAPGV